MKWKNKGHEFDVFVKKWNTEQEYYIWGASNSGNRFYDKFKKIIKIKAFIDSDKSKHNLKIDNKIIKSFDDIKEEFPKIKIIVASQAYYEISKILISLGYVENIDFCNSNMFTATYFMYNDNRLYVHRIDISLTNKCTLKCEKCNMLMPYFENPMHKDINTIKKDIDLYFKWVDNVETLKLLGGEPILYPKLIEVIEYLSLNYKSKIENIDIFTNGTLKLSKELLYTLKKYEITVQISDYSKNSPNLKKVINIVEGQLKEFGVKYTKLVADEWLDFIQLDDLEINENYYALEEKFNKCRPPFRGLFDGKIYYCHLSISAVQANKFKNNINDYFDLNSYDDRKKIELMEFDLGYNNIGYITYCNKCNGCDSVNDKFTEVAKQMKK